MSRLLTALFWILVAAGVLISAVVAWAGVICGCLGLGGQLRAKTDRGGEGRLRLICYPADDSTSNGYRNQASSLLNVFASV